LPDRQAFVTRHLQVRQVQGLKLYLAHPGSGLGRIGGTPPYWAYVWAGGAALAAHVTANPALVRGKRVLDFGAGSGIAGLAAARAQAARVLALDPDPWARAALAENARLNGLDLGLWRGGKVDVVLAGDVFYAPEVAAAVLPRLCLLAATGAQVVLGDPGRRDLPRNGLLPLARYPVPDMGDPPGVLRDCGVYLLQR
jgi:predicted nicotinamide N-methyase